MTRRRASTRLARQATDLSLAVPHVIGHRVLRMAAAGANPSARDRREFARMGNEKVLAFWRSWAAMWMQGWKVQVAFAQTVAATAWAPLLGGRRTMNVPLLATETAARILSAGIAPVRAAAVANSKRLARVRT